MKGAILLFLLASSAFSQQSWKVLKMDYEPVLIGISFLNDNEGYMAGGQNGTPPEGGPQVYKTADAGHNWRWLPHGGAAMMFLDVAMDSTTNGVTAGVGLFGIVPGIEYTVDGEKFNRTLEIEFIDECQSTETVRGVRGAFGLAGEFDKSNGVAMSFDKGLHFTHYDANLTTGARYGSYPSRTTWYVTAGEWPNDARDDAPGIHALTQRIRLSRQQSENDENANYVHNGVHFDLEPKEHTDKNAGYKCQIKKTVDGGKTWQQLYTNDQFYPNGISCPTVNSCWAVGEAVGGPGAGIYILHTGDGGRNWDVQLRNPNPHFSLLAVDFIDEQEGWAAGGELSALHFMGHFRHTVNGGKNWTLSQVPQIYGNDMSFINKNKGWATAFTVHEQSAVVAYN